MKCTNCDNILNENDRFCRLCGAQRAQITKCSNCSNVLQEGDIFCTNCGTKRIKIEKCPNCNSLLKESYHFCTTCGTPINKNSSQKNIYPEKELLFMEEIKNHTKNLTNKIVSKSLIEKQLFLCLTFILSIILMYTKTIEIGAFGMSDSLSLFEATDIKALTIIFTIFYLFSTILFVLPLLMHRRISILHLIPTSISTVGSLIFMLITAIIATKTADKYGADFSMTLTGIVLLILLLLSCLFIALLIWNLIKIKKEIN